MGLRTVLSYRPADIGARTRDGTLIDAWSKWKGPRPQDWTQLKPLVRPPLLRPKRPVGANLRNRHGWWTNP